MVFKHKIGLTKSLKTKLFSYFTVALLIMQPLYGVVVNQAVNAAGVAVVSIEKAVYVKDISVGYTGIYVGLNAKNIDNAAGLEIRVNRNAGSSYSIFATDNVLNAINAGLSNPLGYSTGGTVIVTGSRPSSSWTPQVGTWNDSSRPTSVEVILTRTGDTSLSSTTNTITNEGATPEEVFPVDNIQPTVVNIQQVSENHTSGKRMNVTLTFSEMLDPTSLPQGWYEVPASGKTKFVKSIYNVKPQSVTFKDIAGNSGSYSFNIDITPPTAATQTTSKVLQSDFANAYTTWTYYNDIDEVAMPTANNTHKIAANPTPGVGNNGAVRLNTTAGEKWNLASLQYSGTKLRDISALGFSTYTSNPGSAYINLDVDFNHPGVTGNQGRLVYVPTVSAANTWTDSEAVASNSQWRWSSSNTWQDGVTATTRSWNEIINAFPEATITAVDNMAFGSLYLRSDGASTTYFDNVYLATNSLNVKYNFELATLPAPQNLTPLNGSFTTNPAFNNTWSSVNGAAKYEYRTSNSLASPTELGPIIHTDTSDSSNYDLSSTIVVRSNNIGTPENDYFWQVRAIDAIGTPGEWSSINKVTYDITKPAAPKNLSLKATSTGVNIPKGSATNVANVTADWENGGSEDVMYIYKVWYNNDSQWTQANPWSTSPLNTTSREGQFNEGNGGAYFCVVAVDQAGNKSDCSDTFDVIYDNVAPFVGLNAPVRNDDGTYTITGTTEKPTDKISVTLDGQDVGPVTNNGDGTWVVTTDPSFIVSEGNHIVLARSTDAAGNSLEEPAQTEFTYTAPIVTTPIVEVPQLETQEPIIFAARQTPAAPVVLTPFFNNFAASFNNDGTVSADPAPTAETNTDNGSILGAEDSLAKNAAQADTSKQGYELFGIAWYWILAALAALLAGWWFIAGYRNRKEDKQV